MLRFRPDWELEEAMAASCFDEKEVGNLAFDQGQPTLGGASGGSYKAMVSS